MVPNYPVHRAVRWVMRTNDAPVNLSGWRRRIDYAALNLDDRFLMPLIIALRVWQNYPRGRSLFLPSLRFWFNEARRRGPLS